MIYFFFLLSGYLMDIITKLNWVDLLVAIIMLRTTYVAFQDGLSHEIFPLIGVFSSLILSLHYYKKTASLISQAVINLPLNILNLLSFILLFAAVIFIFKFIKTIFENIVKITWHPFIEKFGGLLAGLGKASMITSAILIMLVLIPLPYLKWSIRDRSLVGMYFLKIGPSVYAKTSRFLPAIKGEGASADSEYIVKDIVSDKAEKTSVKKEAKDIPDWDKPFNHK